MITRVVTATLIGLQPTKVEVEVDSTRGIPGLTLIGLPSKTVNEARERVQTALHNCGVQLKNLRTVVNLAPAAVQKHGSGLDFAIAVGLLIHNQTIQAPKVNGLFFGELSLDGSLKPTPGVLTVALSAHRFGCEVLFFPKGNSAELQSISGVSLFPIESLSEFVQWCHGSATVIPLSPLPYRPPPPKKSSIWASIIGQAAVKRALTLAVAGKHHTVLFGPPGTGKSLISQGVEEILPPLSEKEALEVTQLHSLAGLCATLLFQPPFRQPHHSVTPAGLLGGGQPIRPGEISLAHHGVLFLDEITELRQECLESLRQPLETSRIHLTRVSGEIEFPAHFTLIAAANPCPCGQWGSGQATCRCSPTTRARYLNRLSGPLRDRFDIQVHVPQIQPTEITRSNRSEVTHLRLHIATARKRQAIRWKKTSFSTNSQASWQEITHPTVIAPESLRFLITAFEKYHLSFRGLLKTARVSRTIADLEESDQVSVAHLTEALHYRITNE